MNVYHLDKFPETIRILLKDDYRLKIVKSIRDVFGNYENLTKVIKSCSRTMMRNIITGKK